ncbi:undecaprenyl-diphosphate phosphatase [Marinifilum sp. D737]|uniref:undecaprenyl-diphosphate phosphatase n=1 Tax=Marinifilum sp. D737 TaxID=2969628 RepID=UPI002273C956|nr:undecaprenyl-diphosphate phosphatase [Marinifilum sp. D737]MCY1635837.1 undecaprenyl-diphosphate phosphatase [Marinifilum sp. D737]
MNWIEALILGLLQGLTEFLPVSSSGHLELGKALLGVDAENNLAFTVIVHGATVLSTIIVFRKDILSLFKDVFHFQWNESTQYLFKIAISMIPIGIVGVFFKDEVSELFDNNGILLLVGCMLLVTATLLGFTYYAKQKDKEISFKDALIIGLAQTFAILPGISRSGATIATGLLLGNRKADIAKFSFLMVLVPIIGENILCLANGEFTSQGNIEVTPLIVGFFAAFISGLLACSWMIKLVKKGKLIYFAIYCLIIGVIAIFAA